MAALNQAGTRAMDLSAYTFEIIRKDADVIVYRGEDRRTTTTHAPPILGVSPVPGRMAAATQRRLEHEFSLRTQLDPDWAVRSLALSAHHGQTMLVLENPGGQPLDTLIDGPMGIARTLRLGAAIAEALGRLHAGGLIHKDIKPAHILVSPAGPRVWLMGFGVTSHLPRERQSPGPPEFIAGTLAYMAPEQTGRMNRSIDSRSDLYALGATLYEMATGSLPFTATDPMEWVHCQIAEPPVPPCERHSAVPGMVSAVIMKLLSKTAEERYQTAEGVASDLRRCLSEWEAQGRIAEFSLGANDASGALFIPEKLYGRNQEIDTLLSAFRRVVATGSSELVLVSGYSGVGKSSVVNELHKTLVPPRGLFASGKFDQYKRGIPYATLAQAFQGLIRPLLGKPDPEFRQWRKDLEEALGPNGLLITELVPDLKHAIGEQPPVPVLAPQDAQGRFQLVFRRFIGVFAKREHPLALFIDDLQWLDAATLDLLEDLMTRGDVPHLMLIGAYRNNEVDSAHPLMRRLEAIRLGGATVNEIQVGPLAEEDLRHLLADALHCKPETARPLAQLVFEKTAGNPFFAVQFVSALAEEGLLSFDRGARRWTWDLARIHAKGYTDNVVELMVGKLSRLSVETRQALQQLACLGNSAGFDLLASVNDRAGERIHEELREAVRTGLVIRSEHGYQFLHDRVQEAAYSLIPEGERGAAHLRIGRLLAARTSPGEIEDKIFEIVSQLDRGAGLITSAEERELVARLNLKAGLRAKSSTAYAAALVYLSAGRGLLTEDAWTQNYNLVYELEFNLAECELLTASLAAAEHRLSLLAPRAQGVPHVAAVARLRLTLYTTLDRSDHCVEVFLEYLRRGGINWSPHPSAEEMRREYDQIQARLGGRPIGELIDLPLMDDPDALAALEVLAEMVTPALFTDENLLALVICRMVSLSLEHGNSDGSCFGYVWLGMIAGPRFDNYADGFRFGRLGYELVEKRGLRRFQARTYMSFGNLITPWTKHVRTGRDLVRRAFEAAYQAGDLTFAGYSCNNLNTNLLMAGDPLADVQREAENGLEFAQKARFGLVIDIITAQVALVRNLRGLTPRFGSFDDGSFDERQFEQHLSGAPVLALPECWYWIRKLQARLLADDYPAALEASANARRLLWTSPSFLEVADYHYYSALTHAACCDSAVYGAREAHIDAIAAHHRQLKTWAENCPENFGNRTALVAAEIARIEGRNADAMRLYEEAIASARENDFVQNEALAHERAGRFYLGRGSMTAGRAHLAEARSGFASWGADGKVRQLERLYPQLSEAQIAASSTSTFDAFVEQLDAGTVIKASQALSSEIVPDRLIEALMRLAVEHAGAGRGLLIFIRGDGPKIESEAATAHGRIEVAIRDASVTESEIPLSLLHYVIRTRSRVVLDNASSDGDYAHDPYVRSRGAKSVLCLPIVKQTKLIGALYFENNLAQGAFTAKRVAVLELLAAQAAISLENARLYSDLRRSEGFLADGQSMTSTGSFAWNVANGDLFWSDETYRIFEYDPSLKPSLEMAMQRVHPDDRPTRRRFLEIAPNIRESHEAEYRLLLPDGRIKHLHILARPARSPSDHVEIIGTVMDITAAKRAEETLRMAQENLARVSRINIMGELTASIAHEVNQPLTAVMNNANACLSLLADGSPDIREVREALGEIVYDAGRASAVIARVRQLARKAPFERAPQDLRDVVKDVLALARLETAARRVRVRTELPARLPLVSGDRVQLQQVLLNLIVNGLDAMNTTAEPDRELVVTAHQESQNGISEVIVSVQDRGIGITSGEKDKLFEAFYTTKPYGTGMGLAISRSIIEAHGGRLWAQANSGPGSTFSFSLPIADAVPP